MLYYIAGPKDLPSAVRLMATGLNLGMLVGPAFAAVLISIPAIVWGWGMFINMLLYVPFLSSSRGCRSPATCARPAPRRDCDCAKCPGCCVRWPGTRRSWW